MAIKNTKRSIFYSRQHGFVLITIMVLLSLIALASVHTLQSTHLTLLLASHRTQEVRAYYQLDAVMLATQATAHTEITQTCIPWPPTQPHGELIWVTQWTVKTLLGDPQQRMLFHQIQEQSAC